MEKSITTMTSILIKDDTNNDTFSKYRVTVREDVHMTTHEVNLNWMLGDDIQSYFRSILHGRK